jgi:Flp pilus assembly protein TadG
MARVLTSLEGRSGNVIVLTALCMGILAGFVGLALDGGNLILQHRAAQTAADAGALEGIHEMDWAAADNTTVTKAAQAASSNNGFTDGANGVTVTVNNGPATGPHAGDATYVEVIVKKQVSTVFMALLNQKSMNIYARAVAGPGANAGCVYTLGTSGNGIDNTGTSAINLTHCTIYDDSADSTKGITSSGGGSITATSINVVGGYSGGGSFTPTPTTGVMPVGDPLAYLPAPTVPSTCGAAQSFQSGSNSLSPGCYSGLSLSSSAALSLSPGVYVVNGNFSITGSASMSGSGITFYVTGTTKLAGSGTLNISAPTSGTYNGIIYFQSRTDSNSASFTGGSGSTVGGIFYAPAAEFDYSGGTGQNVSADFVVKYLKVSGNGGFSDYNKLNGESPLQSISIVE